MQVVLPKWDGISYYISEQISHHPPVSAYVFASPENNFIIHGEMRPKSKFYGTSAATHLEGAARIQLLNHPGEEYVITYPSIHVYGILFGKLIYELGDITTIRCDKADLGCKVEFKTKNGPENLLFDASASQTFPKLVAPEDEQDPFESRRLWKNVTNNLKCKNIDAASEEKNAIEQGQRDDTRVREESGKGYNHRFFDVTEAGSNWKLK
ncbi:Oxysterol-binding protein OBPa, partial [Massospora cicadina]